MDDLTRERYEPEQQPRPNPRQPGYTHWRFQSTQEQQAKRRQALDNDWQDDEQPAAA
jgi:hypothetical protein